MISLFSEVFVASWHSLVILYLPNIYYDQHINLSH